MRMYTEQLDDFWKDAEIISVYTDDEAQTDGFLLNVSAFAVEFNDKTIYRMTCGAANALKFESLSEAEKKQTLERIVTAARFDGTGFDAWGICKNDKIADGEKLWLVPNEIGGYTAMLPADY